MGLSIVDIVGGLILSILIFGYFMVVAKLVENIDRRNDKDKILVNVRLQDNATLPEDVFRTLDETDMEIHFLENKRSNS